LPKVIKAGDARQDSCLVAGLPALSSKEKPAGRDYSVFFQEQRGEALDADYVKYYAVIDETPENGEEYKKYFVFSAGGGEDGEDDYRKYYINLVQTAPEKAREGAEPPQDLAPQESAGDVEEKIEEEPAEEPEEEPADETAESVEIEVITEESLLEKAKAQSEEIIAAAKKEAEEIRRKLTREISEAEAKKEAARIEAEDILSIAEEKANAIITGAQTQAREKYETSKQEGHAAGFRQGEEEGRKTGCDAGFAEGQAAGFKQGEEKGLKIGRETGTEEGRRQGREAIEAQLAEKVAQATQKASDIIAAADLEKERIIASADDKIVSISMAVAEKILSRQITDNPFSILPIVMEAARKVADQPRLFVKVSVDNYDLVSAACGDIKKALNGKQEISFAADSSLGPADVVISTGGSGGVDARLNTQLNEIRKTIETVIGQ
jgi:flagellar biosynthesis/type III secretory pathway protein FliH